MTFKHGEVPLKVPIKVIEVLIIMNRILPPVFGRMHLRQKEKKNTFVALILIALLSWKRIHHSSRRVLPFDTNYLSFSAERCVT